MMKKMRWGERKAYVVLVLISLFCSFIVFLVGQANDKNTEHKFCQLMTASLAGSTVPVKPTDPKKAPGQEKLYEEYQIFLHLAESLGCV